MIIWKKIPTQNKFAWLPLQLGSGHTYKWVWLEWVHDAAPMGVGYRHWERDKV